MNNNVKNYMGRSNSICPTPQSILLHFVKSNEIRNIRRLVSTNPVLLSYVYSNYNKPILLIACTEPGIKAETVETLIDLGANLRFASDVDEDWEAIHFAAHATNSAILEVIVNKLSQLGQVNALAKGNNAFHVLIKYGNGDLQEEFLKCARILINSGIDVNQGDEKNKTPIFLAAKKKYREIVKLLLDNSQLSIDLDSKDARGETARNLIETNKLYDGKLPGKFINNNNDYGRVLFGYLKSYNLNGFLNYKNGEIQQLDLDIDDGDSTMLQICCKNGLFSGVEHLLDKGADPNRRAEKNLDYPIELAAKHGYHKIFELLLNHHQITIPKKLLIYLLKNIDNEKFPNIDHEKCYDLLVEKLEVNDRLTDVNYVDESGNSPLHYSVRYADPEKSGKLLKLNASLATKNYFGVMPVQDIDPELLEKHLDNCIEFNFKGKSIEKEDFAVTFNYRTLIPPVSKKAICNGEFDVEGKIEPPTDDFVKETEVIYYMSRAAEYKHLLKHPVIVSFLFMKWHRIRWLFYINLAFYITFFASLVVYIFSSFANFSQDEQNGLRQFLEVVSKMVLCVSFFVLLLRELFQIVVSSRKYLKNFENYIEIILIVITSMILFKGNPSDELRKQLSSLAILLSAFELVLMLGQHPKLSTNVVMLKTVSFNFFKFLLWYSLLIIAFALSFYILFTDESPEEEGPKNATNTEEEEDLFNDPGKSVFKTIIMLTGEFDASSINFRTFPILSKFIFALFIFMIAIILLNLLNGLAVSDTQMIKNDAELVGHIARAQHIFYVESMVLGNIFPETLLNILQNFCCCIPNFQLIQARPLAKRSCIFPYVLNYELTVYPNKQGEIALPKMGRNRRLLLSSCATCGKIYLDKETVRRTNAIVQVKRDQLKSKQQNNYMDKLESMLKIQQVNMDKLDFIIEHLLSVEFDDQILSS